MPTTIELSAPDAAEIHAAIRDRLTQLRPLIEEHARLEEVARILAGDSNGKTVDWPVIAAPPPESAPAPYGYKADGMPRKRPAPSLAAQAKSAATRRASK